MIRKSSSRGMGGLLQLIKYYAAGGFINGVGYLFFLIFVQIGVGHKLAASVLYAIGVVASFWLNRTFVFDSGITLRSSVSMLFIMLVIGYIINISILYLLVDIFKFSPSFVQLFSVVVVSVYFYLFNKSLVHKSRQA